MIPVEYFWGSLIALFAIIGMGRGMVKELGATTILLLSLFALYVGWGQLGGQITRVVQGQIAGMQAEWVEAWFFGISIIFVGYISYAGVVLRFPMKEFPGLLKLVFGSVMGLLNGYLVVGTIWNALSNANYFWPNLTIVQGGVSELHNTIARYLPLSLTDQTSPFIWLVPGMVLLLAKVLK
jgi:uncharacterized membrane protein required for colicin V production